MVYVFLADGFEEAEAIVPIDYMRRAGIEVTTVGVGTSMPKGSHGITVMTDMSEDMFFPSDDTEAVFFPGGGLGTENLAKSETVRRAARLGFGESDGMIVAAICAAPTILAKEGLLNGKKATCFPDFTDVLGESYSDSDVVIDPPYITGRAAGVVSGFALKLVEMLRGTEAAEEVASRICYPERSENTDV
ncbi:MAG: DJ-1/PfpI family protein [Oscillospiraceae bacterium]|nr:DJ-1/PfpI family protein [Oscillospiraceae bacterium]